MTVSKLQFVRNVCVSVFWLEFANGNGRLRSWSRDVPLRRSRSGALGPGAQHPVIRPYYGLSNMWMMEDGIVTMCFRGTVKSMCDGWNQTRCRSLSRCRTASLMGLALCIVGHGFRTDLSTTMARCTAIMYL